MTERIRSTQDVLEKMVTCEHCNKVRIGGKAYTITITDGLDEKVYFCSLKCFEDYGIDNKLWNGRLERQIKENYDDK